MATPPSLMFHFGAGYNAQLDASPPEDSDLTDDLILKERNMWGYIVAGRDGRIMHTQPCKTKNEAEAVAAVWIAKGYNAVRITPPH